jgi:hypothetical protein
VEHVATSCRKRTKPGHWTIIVIPTEMMACGIVKEIFIVPEHTLARFQSHLHWQKYRDPKRLKSPAENYLGMGCFPQRSKPYSP